jgi:hypothetical protein
MLSQKIRDHVMHTYIKPAREKGAHAVHVKAGEVHRQLGLYNSVPSVCQALRSKKFEQQGEVELVNISGPPSGLSTKTEFVFRVMVSDARKNEKDPQKAGLAEFYGSGKDYFKAYGGADKFLKRAREGWTKKVSLRP